MAASKTLLKLTDNRQIKSQETNQQTSTDNRHHIKAFPGAKSTQRNHYVTPTLEEYSYDAAIINAGINHILRSKHYDEIDKLSRNIIKVAKYLLKI